MLSEKELKLILLDFKESNFLNVGTLEINSLTKAMLHHIGSTDPELRDHLIYPSFINLIVNNYYTKPELKELLYVCLDEQHLLLKLEDNDEDAVFTRAFSSLIIAVLLHVNRQNSFLAESELDMIADQLINYIHKEEDVRGFVEGKGWAHSIAHIADALDELVKNKGITISKLEEVAMTILEKMYFDKGYFLFEEDERMVTALISILNREIDQQHIINRITDITAELKQNFISGTSVQYMQRTNFKQFLRSLLLHLEVIDKHAKLREHLKNVLQSINQPYYNT